MQELYLFTTAENLLLCLHSCSQGLVVVWELNQERLWETRINLCVFRTQRPKSYSSLLGYSHS